MDGIDDAILFDHTIESNGKMSDSFQNDSERNVDFGCFREY